MYISKDAILYILASTNAYILMSDRFYFWSIPILIPHLPRMGIQKDKKVCQIEMIQNILELLLTYQYLDVVHGAFFLDLDLDL